MSSDLPTAFRDNWGYLRTELNWLDRLLRVAVARRQQEKQAINRVAKTPGDRVSSDWWKGLVTLEGNIGHDELGKREIFPPQAESLSYQQQLQEKIKVSHQQGIKLGLPMLCDRAHLTLFEKQLVLASLAPEVNRRYSRLYQYLQDDNQTELPTVDLILRLFCRGDNQWRDARNRLINQSPLTQLGLVEFLPTHSETFLQSRVKLADRLINYLLADHPAPDTLTKLLHPDLPSLNTYLPHKLWSDLILPSHLQQQLKKLSQAWQFQDRVAQLWFPQKRVSPGQIALFVGESGTGKTAAVEAIATELHQPITCIDLNHALFPPAQFSPLWETQPPILLIKSAQHWLKRIYEAELRQFLYRLQQQQTLTIFTLHPPFAGTASLTQWIRQGIIHHVLNFPIPNKEDRCQLWQQVFSPEIALSPTLSWEDLAERWLLTGGEIEAIAYQATFFATIEAPDAPVTFAHLQQALSAITPTLALRNRKQAR